MRLLWGVISIRAGERFALRLHLKLFTQVAARKLKRQVIPDLWSTNRQCFVGHDERRVRTAKQLFVWRSQWTRWRIVTNERCQIRWTSTLPRLVSHNCELVVHALLWARLIGKYCFARWRLSSVVVIVWLYNRAKN